MREALLAAILGVAAVLGAWPVPGEAADKRFSRAELLVSTQPMSREYRKVLSAQPRETGPLAGTALRIERVFGRVLQQAKRLRPGTEQWDWQLVLVANDGLAPFALPDGQIFMSPNWVSSRGLTDAEIALVVAHEMAHVLADHLLELVSAFAAARPAANMRVSDVFRMLEQEWYLARELEPLMQAQEQQADRIGMTLVCGAGISRSGALTLFDKMARAERGASFVNSHADSLERKASLAHWTRAQNLVCLE